MLGGDLGDWISPKDPRYDEDCIMSPDEQVSALIKLLKGKNIISMIDGNHENSIKRYTGFDVSRLISDQLDIPFNGPNTYVKIDGKTIYNYHGTGGGAFKGTILTKLEKVPMHRAAHVYVQGHSHQLFHRSSGQHIDSSWYLQDVISMRLPVLPDPKDQLYHHR